MKVVVECHPEGAVFSVLAQPAGRKNAIRGIHDGRLRVSVTAVPEKGKANEAVLDVVCDALRLRRSQLAVVAGETDRRKKILVRAITVEELHARLTTTLDQAKP